MEGIIRKGYSCLTFFRPEFNGFIPALSKATIVCNQILQAVSLTDWLFTKTFNSVQYIEPAPLN